MGRNTDNMKFEFRNKDKQYFMILLIISNKWIKTKTIIIVHTTMEIYLLTILDIPH